MNIAIYGAQAMAVGAYDSIKILYPTYEVQCFLVTSLEGNPVEVEGVPVRELAEFAVELSAKQKQEVTIWIATPENVMDAIEESVIEAGFSKIDRLTSLKWAELVGRGYEASGIFTPLYSLPSGESVPNVSLYMAKFYKDKALSSQYEVPSWVTPVQVGAALTDERVANLLDCTGDNISTKNVNYSELTLLYWLWKNKLANATDGYYGLVHYRRILELSREDLGRLAQNDIDLILPYPMPHLPNCHAHHERYLKDVDYKAMRQALSEISPEYDAVFDEVMSQKYLYNYNIILAKRDILCDYCAWLFPILERTEELSVPKGAERADRYIGYMGETLLTLYFMHNKDKYKIAHTACRFLK